MKDNNILAETVTGSKLEFSQNSDITKDTSEKDRHNLQTDFETSNQSENSPPESTIVKPNVLCPNNFDQDTNNCSFDTY